MAMATYTVITYRCPRCRADIGRRFGLLTKLNIVCPNCSANVRIGADVIRQNWGFNFAWASAVLIWLALGVGVLADRDLAAAIGRQTIPADTFEHRLGIAGICAIPALFAGLAMGGVGMVLGAIVAAGAKRDSADAAPSSWTTPGQGSQPARGDAFPPVRPGQQRLRTMGAGYATQPPPEAAPPQPPKRNILVRVFFVLLWPVVFFFGAGIVLAVVAVSTVKSDAPPPVAAASTVGLIESPLGQGPLLAAASLLPTEARDEALRKQASKNLGEKAAPWLVLGTVVVFALGCAGLAPFTGSKKGRQPAQTALS
jgi:DNA-directed RNA polymerase subunit RPC12/RpoP